MIGQPSGREALRFCMVTTFYPPHSFGGDGTYVRGLSHELARRGHLVDVVHCVDSYRPAGRARPADATGHPNITVHSLRHPLGVLSPLLTHQLGVPVLQARRLRAILGRPYDVIHFHNISLVGGPSVLRYGGAIKLYTLHDYWLVCPTHALYRFNREPCAKASLCLLCTLSYRRPPQWWRYTRLMNRSIRYVDAFIAPSLTSQRKHEQLGLPGRIVHLPNFVRMPGEEEGIERAVRQVPGKAPYFLFVGRLEHLKGLHTLIPVFRRYDKAQLWIAGAGSEEAALRRLSGPAANIRFLGQQSANALTDLYRGAVAVLYPSLNYQIGVSQPGSGLGAPLVIMEAFSMRTPVIASRAGSIPAIVEQTGGGLVYSSSDELAAALDRLVAHPAERDRLGMLGYEAYRRQWTADAHLSGYLSLIDEIASGRTRGRAAAV